MEVFKELLFPILILAVAALTTTFADGLQRLFAVLDRMPAAAKRILVGVIAVLLTKAYTVLGITDLPTDILGLTGENVAAVVSAFLAFLFHKADRTKENLP
jgi:hypothetical protein